MGLLKAAAGPQTNPMRPWNMPQPSMGAPQMPQAPMGGGLASQFSGAPGFQQQLQALMAGQGPGAQGQVQFTPPQAPMNTQIPMTGGGQNSAFRGDALSGVGGLNWLGLQAR